MTASSKSTSKTGSLTITRKDGESVTVVGGDIKITLVSTKKGVAVIRFEGGGRVLRTELNKEFSGPSSL